MEKSRASNPPVPPGIISSVKDGFDAVATHIGGMLLPLALNLFFWLGPRLQMNALFESIKADVIAIWQSGGISAADIERALGWYESSIPAINLFWLARALPVGVSSLQIEPAAATPLGAATVWQASSSGLLSALCLLPLLGWALGGLYFRGVANLARAENAPRVGMARALSQTVGLSLLWGALLLMLAIPLLLVFTLLAQINSAIANAALLFAFFMLSGLVAPAYFWAHGIFLNGQNVFSALKSSWRMTRFALPASSMFVLTVFVMTVGLNYLWYLSPPNSWVTLLAVFGHSFTSAGLLAASFIYYRDMSAWSQAIWEQRAKRPANLKP